MEDYQFTLNKNHPQFDKETESAMLLIIEHLDVNNTIQEEILSYANSGVRSELFNALELMFGDYWTSYVTEQINDNI
jgi:hypothetical protein